MVIIPNKTKVPIGRVLKDGALAAWPICLGYIPIGLAFGVLAQKAGLHPFAIGMMSLFVFAGSSQFIALSMLAAGAAPLAIILTAFTVNLRHFLMSSSLAMYMGQTSKKRLSLFAYGVTDESFAVNLFRFRQGGWDVKRALTVNHIANIAWVASTLMGGYGGELIPERALGIDYALNSMFICLLVFQLRGKKYVITAVLSGGIAVLLALVLPGNSYVVLASIIAATLAVYLGRKGAQS
ncbi:MAG: AzlC family ABC transporter permease [Desulfobacterales bacterium]|nr:AzlC family ABC transporter permease [Desulfobacterales bacterium]